MRRAGSLHLIGTPEVVGCRYIEELGGLDIYAQVEVVSQHTSAAYLVGCGVEVLLVPACEVDESHRDTDGRMAQFLGETHFQVKG